MCGSLARLDATYPVTLFVSKHNTVPSQRCPSPTCSLASRGSEATTPRHAKTPALPGCSLQWALPSGHAFGGTPDAPHGCQRGHADICGGQKTPRSRGQADDQALTIGSQAQSQRCGRQPGSKAARVLVHASRYRNKNVQIAHSHLLRHRSCSRTHIRRSRADRVASGHREHGVAPREAPRPLLPVPPYLPLCLPLGGSCIIHGRSYSILNPASPYVLI